MHNGPSVLFPEVVPCILVLHITESGNVVATETTSSAAVFVVAQNTTGIADTAYFLYVFQHVKSMARH